MQQLIEILTIKITPEMSHYLSVISKKYNVKRSYFVRKAIMEKLQRDIPKIRTEREREFCPF